ncbi:MDR/zinc-dependent alcohol dehydrogenase-like family protein [Methylocaldum szegediense]|uniref:Threonine dehydrogenase-like Zn-dependent dehydrogenase n=1 Tax=Methylocaldum szegediense TaxID=73780 RepID=A0ABM9I6P7_9GAMM|nr:zinc-binding dehydrogenase [Methylocaldum szegediense]CAI8925474.1 Threonine dehydrogenase-like Zn-dependent dehydrogenase [Methylocaldum szegediense]
MAPATELTCVRKTADPVRCMAAVFNGPRDIRVTLVTVPPPGPGQVRVKLEGCGVCASNLPVWEGRPWFDYPFPPGAPGHEGWGRVEAVGEDVDYPAIGTRVAILSDRAYAQYELVDRHAAIPLPPALDGWFFPGEPLACAMNVFQRSGIRPGETVAVVGVGFMGALLVGLATAAGARVVALSRRPYSLDIARRQGAAETLDVGNFQAALDRVKALTDGAGCDCVIEAAGEQCTLDLASELTRVRGRLVIAGYHQDGSRTVNMQLWNWRGLDVINAHERDPKRYAEGLYAAIEAASTGRFDPSPLLTHRFSLTELPRAFDLMGSRPEGFLKAVVLP